MIRAVVKLLVRTYIPFLVLTSFWYLFSLSIGDLDFGLSTFAYTIVIMISAYVYYIIESSLSTSKSYVGSLIDVSINVILFLGALATLALFLGKHLSMSYALLLAGLLSFMHPLTTDIPHVKRFFRTSVSTVAPYVCLPIDWTLTLLCILAFVLES